MKDWIIDILMQAQSDSFTGRIRAHFGNGKAQHVVRTIASVDSPDDSTLPIPDPNELIDQWMAGGRTGHIDFFFIGGVLAEIEASDTLFPPKPSATPARMTDVKCPICPDGQRTFLLPKGDYGNFWECLTCKWKGTMTEAIKKERERGGSVQA